MQQLLTGYPNLTLRPANVFDIRTDSIQDMSARKITGVTLGELLPTEGLLTCLTFLVVATESGELIPCSQVVICTGTFLSGEIHLGKCRTNLDPTFLVLRYKISWR